MFIVHKYNIFYHNIKLITYSKNIFIKNENDKKIYKYPKLNELTAFMGITDKQILTEAERLFGCSCGYHDARFDTTALYLAMNKGMNDEDSLSVLKGYL